ncbi:MAG: NADH-quinone oxidoreductase subunit A [Candidatus Sericytochromatia bacterium]|jgi:NADH-quinone oxidoreductase subunit A|nr:NADH-quinone oxidoreductase subunit A [Candidatus Sericytochromatia bacterium]
MSENALAMITVLFLALAVPLVIVVISRVLGGSHPGSASKWLPYESGIMQTVGTAEDRVSIKFYLTAIIFIIFDVEAVFLYPWAVNFRHLGMNGLFEMLLFLTVLLAGFVYIWKKGALKWD